MKSALRVILGISVLAAATGCDNSGDSNGSAGSGPIAVGGSSTTSAGTTGTTAGTGVVPTGGTDTSGGGSGMVGEGVPLTPTDGWVDGMSNTLMIQGAMFDYGDTVSLMGETKDFTGSNACIKGTAAKVDLKCTPMAPATDCYGQFWGAAIGLNLNQPIDPTTMMGAMPMPYDASALKGFAFEISGAAVPTTLRFKIENATGEFCNTAAKPVMKGANSFLFSDLQATCWKPAATNPTGETAKSGILKIAWQVVTNTTGPIPFDYCVSNVRALQ